MKHFSKKLLNFSSQRRALFEALLEEEGMGIVPQIPSRKEASPVTLSFAQQRLFFLEQLVPGSPFYNLPQAYHLVGPLNVVRLSQSLNEIVRRHESLRTTFAIVEEQPVQVIHPTLKLPLPVIELAELPEKERAATVSRLMTQEAQKPFDLLQGALLRSTLLRLGSHEHILLLTMHHIISDGWSLEVLIKELAALYQAYCTESPFPQPELPIQYADFALWQRKWLQGEALKSQLTYWTQQLDGMPTVFELPTDRPRPAVQSFEGASYSFMLPAHRSQRLKRLCQQENVTLFMALLALFKVLLYRYSGQDDIVVGTPIANRNRVELEGLIGFFVNSLVLRTKLSSQMSFRELLAQVHEVCLGAYAHQELPFEKLVEQLQPERDLSRNPLFQVMFTLQNAPLSLELSGLTWRALDINNSTTKFDLTLTITNTERELAGLLVYNTDLFDACTISRMAEHLQVLLKGIVDNPQQRLVDLPLLTEEESSHLLVKWADTQAKLTEERCLHELFEAQVERMPNRVAVVFNEQHLTYQELNQQANQLAHYLCKLGVGPEVLVGICVERSLEMVVGILGILKAGGAYVPLSPVHPKERLAFILQDAEVSVLLTQKKLVAQLPEHKAHLICLDTIFPLRESERCPVSGVTAENLAYVIYTSGSTGKPKGVLISHRSIATHCLDIQASYQLESSDSVLQFASFNFDVSLEQIFCTLTVGAKLVLRGTDIWSTTEFHQKLLDFGLTVVNLSTAYWHQLAQVWADAPELAMNNQLRLVIVGGELMLPEGIKLWGQTPMRSVHLLNAYGPTESTITATLFEIPSHFYEVTPSKIPIGRPIASKSSYILDTYGNPAPIGIPGELHIGGVGLARGYLNRPKLTAKKFIPNPYSQLGSRLYKTGDKARYLSDGNIEFLGRLDYQLKIRGFRIELGEIETVLSQHFAVRECVVVSQENELGKKHLVAVVVPKNKQTPTSKELRDFLQTKLPQYMVPTAFVMLDKLPITPNGKVDRRALPLPDTTRSETTFVAPRTLTEKKLTDIWSQVLAIKEVGVYDNFFELGGHSLLATQIVSRVRDTFQIELPLHSLFSASSVADLAERIETFHWARPVSRDEGNEYFPLSVKRQN